MKMMLLTLISSILGADVVAAPLVIGHRGACGHRPEHTMASYELAIEFGADYIEPDLVMTKDNVLVVRHENEISGTTDVAQKFPNRQTTKTVDGNSVTGWFIEDFTLKEVKTLRAKERLAFRDHSYDYKFEIPTFREVIELAKRETIKRKRVIGIYPEMKHPSYFRSIGKALEPALAKELRHFNWDKKGSPVFVQCFEMTALRNIKKQVSVPLIFLVDAPDAVPYDHVLAGDKRTYMDLVQPASLKELSKTIYGIGPDKRYIIPEVSGVLQKPTSIVADAHAAGLKVHPYTFRSDKEFLHASYGGDPSKEYYQYFDAGVDAVFSDFPDDAVKARQSYKATTKTQ